MISNPRSTFFCFDNKKEFKICKNEEICHNHNSPGFNFLYTDDKELMDSDINNQLRKINEHFRSVALFDFIRFNSWNRLKSKSNKISNNYSIVIGVNKNEDYNIYTKYNLYCNQWNIIILGLFGTVFLFTCPLIFGYLSDLFGRKKIMILLLTLQIIGGCILLCSDFYINGKVKELERSKVRLYGRENENDKKNDYFDYTTSTVLTNETQKSLDPYINSLNNDFMQQKESSENFSFDMKKFDVLIQKKYYFLIKSKQVTKLKTKTFSEIIVFLITGTILKFCTVPTIFNLCLCYVMELSFNSDMALTNYNFTIKAYVFSYILSYYIIIPLNNIFQTLGIIASFQFIMLIFFIYMDIESPRYCYENSEWEILTQIIQKNIISEFKNEEQDNIIRNIAKKKDENIYIQEINKNKNRTKWSQFLNEMKKRIFFSNFIKTQKILDQKIKNEEIKKIEFSDHLKSPILMLSIFNKNKYYKDFKFILFSMIFNFAIVNYLILTKYSTGYFITREFLYAGDYIINCPFYINFFIILLVNYIYGLSAQVYGYPFIMSISYFFILIFSIIIGYYNYFSGFIRNSLERKFDFFLFSTRPDISFFIEALIFFSNGLYLQLFIYIVQYSLTSCRATFFGLIQSVFYLFWIISICVSSWFIEMFDIFIIQCSIVGILISYFLVKGDGTYIKDFRILEIYNRK